VIQFDALRESGTHFTVAAHFASRLQQVCRNSAPDERKFLPENVSDLP
jgi:hypothetical protein